VCLVYGEKHDKDINAAKNIFSIRIRQIA